MPKKKTDAEAIANQLTFISAELRKVGERMRGVGCADLAQEMDTLANSAEFFGGEFERIIGRS